MSLEALTIDSGPQLFLDDTLVQECRGLDFRLHSPRPAEIVLERDRPWEDTVLYDATTILDDGRYRMWYRTNLGSRPYYTGYMESGDGIHWEKPSLGLIPFEGSTANNLVWSSGPGREGGYVLSVFKDGNPAAPESERYKAIAIGVGGMIGLTSPDGLRWQRLRDEVIIPCPEGDGTFDSYNIALWDAARGQYAAYLRGWKDGVRLIRRGVSANFRDWSPLEYIDMGDAPSEHLYKNAVTAYYRRPELLFMFPKRFLPERQFDPEWAEAGLSDIVFMFSRDGLRFDRRYMEAFIRPGPERENWHERAIEVGPGLVPTGPGEMSLYLVEHYRTPSVRIRRMVLREDGFVSLHAPYAGGEMISPPLLFTGRQLTLNYATSAAGSVRVELQDAAGRPIPSFALADCPEIFGDEPARRVTWVHGSDLSALAGRPTRIRIVARDADVYAFRVG